MHKIIILDFASGTVYSRNIGSDLEGMEPQDIMEYFADILHLHSSDCQWMITSKPINHTN